MLEDAQKLYEDILQTANMFLTSAKRFNIKALQNHDPSFEELAGIMESIAAVVYDLADDIDPMMGQKAADYSNCMTKMALAIRNDDKVLLFTIVGELEKKPFC